MRPEARFLFRFFGILVPAYLLIAWNPVNDHVIEPFSRTLATLSAFVLNLLGQGVEVIGTVVGSPRFSVDINNGCNGVEAMLILLASILAFPASVRARAAGLLTGVLIVQVLNGIRVVSLYLLGLYQPQLFDVFHTAIWQSVIIAAAILFFLVWSTRVGPHRLANAG